MSAESGQFSRWGRGARLTRRVREEPPPGELARVYFDRNATQSGATRQFSRWGGGSGGMDRRLNAAWVSPQAGKPSRNLRAGSGWHGLMSAEDSSDAGEGACPGGP